MNYKVNDYDILVGRDRSTGEYVAIVREFPSLSWVSEYNRSLAAQGMRTLLLEVLTDMEEDGETPPTPLGFASKTDSTTSLRELAST